MNRSLLVGYSKIILSSNESIQWRKYSLINVDFSCYIILNKTCSAFSALLVFIFWCCFFFFAVHWQPNFSIYRSKRWHFNITTCSRMVFCYVLVVLWLMLLLCLFSFLQLLLHLRLLCTFFLHNIRYEYAQCIAIFNQARWAHMVICIDTQITFRFFYIHRCCCCNCRFFFCMPRILLPFNSTMRLAGLFVVV